MVSTNYTTILASLCYLFRSVETVKRFEFRRKKLNR